MKVCRGVHVDTKVDQCEQGGHKSPGYPVLVWDLKKRSKVTSAKHSYHLAYPAHVGINFPSI
jgi:hypothetical protein